MSKHKMLQIQSIKLMTFDKQRWRVFGDWLKTAREKAHLSQDGLGDLIGKDRQTIYRIENALSGTRRETVLAIAEALKVDKAIALNKAGFALQINEDSTVPKPIIEALAREGTLKPEDEILIAEFITRLKQTQ